MYLSEKLLKYIVILPTYIPTLLSNAIDFQSDSLIW